MDLRKTTAALLAAIMLLCAWTLACGPRQNNGEEPEELKLTEAQKERILELAQAFSLYGPVDVEEGFPITRLEYLIPCFWSCKLEGSEVEGYGRISIEEADASIDGMLPGAKIPELVRTAYDPSLDQDYYVRDGYYYIRLTDASKVDCELESWSFITDEAGENTGVRATVKVSENGKPRAGVTLVLPFSEAYEFSVSECTISEYE